MRWREIAGALALMTSACGGERPAATRPVEAAATEAARSEPARTASDPSLPSRPPPGTPAVDGRGATLWTDPARGLVLRAPREPVVGSVEAAWGEVSIVARDRRAPAHLASTWLGDLYWVEHRPAEGRCDFVRLAHDATEPEILFEDDLGDPGEPVCPTAITIDIAGGDRFYWVHGAEIRSAAAEPGASTRVVVRDQEWATELAANGHHVYWLAQGADPRSGVDLTGRGSLRAAPVEGGAARVLGEGLTAPYGLEITGTAIELRERGSDAVRTFPWASPPVPPPG